MHDRIARHPYQSWDGAHLGSRRHISPDDPCPSSLTPSNTHAYVPDASSGVVRKLLGGAMDAVRLVWVLIPPLLYRSVPRGDGARIVSGISFRSGWAVVGGDGPVAELRHILGMTVRCMV